MAWIQLPIVGDVEHQSLQFTLDDKTYSLRFLFSPKVRRWTVQLWDDQDSTHLASARLVPRFFLFTQQLPGAIWIEAPAGLKGELADLSRIIVKYIDAAERAARAAMGAAQ